MRRYQIRKVYLGHAEEMTVDLADDEQIVGVYNLGGQGPSRAVIWIQKTEGKLVSRVPRQNGTKHREDEL